MYKLYELCTNLQKFTEHTENNKRKKNMTSNVYVITIYTIKQSKYHQHCAQQ